MVKGGGSTLSFGSKCYAMVGHEELIYEEHPKVRVVLYCTSYALGQCATLNYIQLSGILWLLFAFGSILTYLLSPSLCLHLHSLPTLPLSHSIPPLYVTLLLNGIIMFAAQASNSPYASEISR